MANVLQQAEIRKHLETEQITTLRHYCRNPKCRTKLTTPADNPHKAFCAAGCYSQFYRNRCIVCEKELPAGRSDRRFCRKPGCRHQYRRNPPLYAAPEVKTGQGVGCADLALRNPIKSGTKTGDLLDRPWRIVAGPKMTATSLQFATIPLDPTLAARLTRTHEQYYRDAGKVMPAEVGGGQ
jgi:hypothetical protein